MERKHTFKAHPLALDRGILLFFFFLLVVNAANIYDFCHTQFPAYLVKISITRSS